MLMCIVFFPVPARPHYWTRLIRFRSCGPSEFLSLPAVRLGYVDREGLKRHLTGTRQPYIVLASRYIKRGNASPLVVVEPANIAVSPSSSPPGTFRAEERLRLSDRNSILMTQINVYIMSPVVMEKCKFV